MESCKSSNPMDCIEWFADRIVELEAQIDKMKNCYNCEGYYTEQCLGCEDYCNWELRSVKELKEND